MADAILGTVFLMNIRKNGVPRGSSQIRGRCDTGYRFFDEYTKKGCLEGFRPDMMLGTVFPRDLQKKVKKGSAWQIASCCPEQLRQ